MSRSSTWSCSAAPNPESSGWTTRSTLRLGRPPPAAGPSGIVLGALLGVPVAGLALGAATGALAAKFIDLGIPQDFVDELTRAIEPGRIVVAILARTHDSDAVLAAVTAIEGGTVVAGDLPAEVMAAVDDAVAGYHWDRG